LVGERARIVREIGWVIGNKFEGSFTKFVDASGYDVPTLILQIVQYFSGFRDEAIYDGE
jgi:hypothetical protein